MPLQAEKKAKKEAKRENEKEAKRENEKEAKRENEREAKKETRRTREEKQMQESRERKKGKQSLKTVENLEPFIEREETPQTKKQDSRQGSTLPSSSGGTLQELTRCALLTAIALCIFMIEARIPLPIAIPGAKLGLANAVTLYATYRLGIVAAGKILFCRVVLGAIFSGQLLTLLYSATGGLFCLVFLAFLSPFLSWEKCWFVSPCCALAHSCGQVLLASFIMGRKEIFYWLPYLVLLSVISGVFVGIATQQLLDSEWKRDSVRRNEEMRHEEAKKH